MEFKKEIIMLRNDITNEQVYKLYFTKNLSCSKVSKILNCDRNLIKNRIRKMGLSLKSKSMSEHVRDGMKVSVPMTQELLEILDGELLGDACLISPTGFQAYFSECVGFDKKEWLKYIYDMLANNKIPIKENAIYYRRDKPGWQFHTRSTIELGNLHKKWYIENKSFNFAQSRTFSNRRYIKIIPKDISITPCVLLHWYIGDGSNKKNGGSILCTNGFTYNEVEFLRFRLKEDLEISTSHYKDGTIGFAKGEQLKLLDVIGLCPVKCYEYKWKVKPIIRSRKINSTIDMKIVESYMEDTD
jgi:hypothetical protein